ncbi:MAG TPA: hypothetical protein VJ142_01090 [Candidatus Nanoarchaeia archaeon]|nr:hypothetical protein [Candidatus Nanoarchaeia archaeon]
MRHKNSWGLLFLFVSLAFLFDSFNPTISGGIIGINTDVSISFIFGLVFFILSTLVFASRQTLEAIIIPTGDLKEDRVRAETAKRSKGRLKDHGYLVISGHYPHGSLEGIRRSQPYGIYKILRENNDVIPQDMLIEGQSHDTLENTLYSLKKIKQRAEKEGRTGPLDIGVATYHGHFRRFNEFHKKAVEKGLIGRDDFRLHEIPTPETGEERRYESSLLRRLAHRFKLENIGRYKSKKGGVKHAEPSPLVKLTNRVRDILK